MISRIISTLGITHPGKPLAWGASQNDVNVSRCNTPNACSLFRRNAGEISLQGHNAEQSGIGGASIPIEIDGADDAEACTNEPYGGASGTTK